MKYKILTTLFLGFICFNTYSQENAFGIKGGLNLAFMSVDDANDNNIIPGFHAGVWGKLMITENFGIQPEVLYSMKGVKTTYDNIIAEGESKLNVNYIDIPVYLVFNLSEDFDFHLGPFIGLVMNAKVETDTEVLDFFDVDSEDDIDKDNFNNLDFGISGGLGFVLKPVTLGFNYNLSLAEAAKEDRPIERLIGDARNNVIQIYIGFTF